MQKYVLHNDIETTVNRLISLGPLAHFDPSFRTYTVKSARWNSGVSGNREFYTVRFLLHDLARLVDVPSRFTCLRHPGSVRGLTSSLTPPPHGHLFGETYNGIVNLKKF